MAHPDLRTPRLLLRLPRPTDIEPWTEILQEPAVARFWSGYNRERVRQELASPEDDTTVLAIEAREAEDGGRPIGAIQYSQQPDPEYRHAGIDLFLGTRWHGRGLGSEAIRAVVSHLFYVLGHHRVVIDPAAGNQRAVRAYERVGFRQVGLLRQYERGPDGSFHDGLLMELLATDYLAHEAARSRPSPVPSCTLRVATEADVPLLVAMMVAFNQHEGIAWDPGPGEVSLRRLLGDPGLGQVTLLCLSGTPAGYAVVTYGYDLEFGGRDAFLTELYLGPASRGQGIGRRALDLLLEDVRAHGAHALHLQVRADNAPAQRLYRSAGFAGTTRHFFTRLLGEEA